MSKFSWTYIKGNIDGVGERFKAGYRALAEGVRDAITVGPVSTVKAADLARDAVKTAQNSGLPDEYNGKQDAYRHAYWSCEMTKKIGEEEAEKIGNIHEEYGKNPADEIEMDLNNNAAGRKIASEGGKNVNCRQAVWDALENGQLLTSPNAGTTSVSVPKTPYY